MDRLVYGLFYGVSLLPLRILYLFSDLGFFIIYHLMGYRKEIVAANLLIAFPEKAEAERKQIARQFYRNFCDSFIETLKSFSAGNRFIHEHFNGDYSVFEELKRKGHGKVQLHSGHFFNWEYANLGIPLQLPYLLLTVYMPINNGLFDRIFIKLRKKTGAALADARNLRTEVIPYRHKPHVIALVADQNPAEPNRGFWVNFFSKPAPFIKAPESGARRGNIPVVFTHFTRRKRGYYNIHFTLANETPCNTYAGELTVQYVRYLEEAIRSQPASWLWSHRRWKMEWKPEYGEPIG
jgi:Kdo2-lipid IVA lauroyltransferase/acyltransferase